MTAPSRRFAHSAEAFGELAAQIGDGAELSATRLFGWLSDDGVDGLLRRIERLMPGWSLSILALPNTRLGAIDLRMGDLLVRAARGQRFGAVAVIAGPEIVTVDQLSALGWRGEGDPRPPPGRYVRVVDLGPYAGGDQRPLARRVANGAGLAPPDTLVMRLLQESDSSVDAQEGGVHPTLRQGSRGEAVREAQTKLNAVHAADVQAGGTGLTACPLTADGAFGSRTRAAVIAFQRQAFPASPSDWDGVIGAKTWTALDAQAVAPAPGPQPAPPPLPGPLPAPPSPAGAVTAGREVVQHLPLLASHRGTAPDLILKWNDMASVPEAVDVVVHLHGHSGQQAAMRLDRDKEAISGLDFADPHAPHDAGRTTPTLLVLPRGSSNSNDHGNGYSFPALIAAGGLEQLIDDALSRFAAHVGASSVARGRLILTCHSGGGAGLIGLLASGRDPDEVHVFDAFYQDPTPVADWARRRLAAGAASPALRVLYLDHGSTYDRSTAFAPAVAALAAAAGADARRFRVEATTIDHNNIPPRFGWQLLRDAGEDLPLRAPLPHDAESPDANDAEGEPHPTLRNGSRGEAVREAQTKLNLIHAHMVAQGGAGLADCPLTADGAFGHHTHNATIAFQHLAFPASPNEWDGVVGPKTWAALDALTVGPGPAPGPAPGPGPAPPQPGPPPPGPAPATGPLNQASIDALSHMTFSNAAELNGLFASVGGFQAWFNAELSGKGPFTRGRGGALAMPTSAGARARFDAFWDRLALAYDTPRISILEFACLICIVMNETDGDFATLTETSGRNHAGRTDSVGPHPGLAYFFDKILPRKASYNRLGRTAGANFNDPVFIAAHGSKGGAGPLAGHGDDFNGVWHGRFYPQSQFSTDDTVAETEFIRETDFYKFRGRGVIQTTARGSYLRFVRFIQAYTGPDPGLQALRARWASMTPDDAASNSSNADWEVVFGTSDALARAISFHAGGPNVDYRPVSRDAAALQAVPAGSDHPQRGSIAYMGWRISGSIVYGAGVYRDRVIALLDAIARSSSGPAPPGPGPTPTPTPPQPQPPQPAPPTPDEATARAQWDAHPRVHAMFDGQFGSYLEMAPLYAAKGIGDAADYLDRNIVPLRLFGQQGSGHRDFVPIFAQVEAAIGAGGPNPPLVGTVLGCLNPRPIRGTTNHLSNHALGRAIDLNPHTNPMIDDHRDFLVIEAVTGANLHPLSDPAELLRLSRAFASGFSDAWVAQQTNPEIVAACANQGVRTRLNRYATQGFCTLDQRLIEALVAAGLRWGGAYHATRKDFMHFEFLNP